MGNMNANSRIDTDWKLITSETPEALTVGFGTHFLVPEPSQPKQVPLCFRLLLPIRDYNARLVEVLNACPIGRFDGCDIVVGIFAADSFFPFVNIIRALERHKITAVANFPTVLAYGPVIEKTLDQAGLGFTRECTTLSKFRDHGYMTAVMIRSQEQKKNSEAADNFALIELAYSENQADSKLFGRREKALRMYLTPRGLFPKSGRPANIDGIIFDGSLGP